MTELDMRGKTITDEDEPTEETDDSADGSELAESSESPESVGDDTPDTDRRRRNLQLGLLMVAVLALAAGLIVWGQSAGHDDAGVKRAELRDTVLITARTHIETLNTLDYRDVPGGLEKWQDATTGTLKDQLAATDAETIQLMADQQKVSTGKVIDAAVVDLTNDTATVIASVEVTVREGADPDAEPTVKRNRYAADLVKVGDRWLLDTLNQVAVNIS